MKVNGSNFGLRVACSFLLALGILAQGDDNPPWKTKQIAAWTEDDAKALLTNSPWVKTFTPTQATGRSSQPSRPRMGMGGIGYPGVPMGMPMPRRYPAGGNYPGGQQSSSSGSNLPKLTLRWESAMPVRTAELKAHDNDAPVIDDKHYAIAVYGLPNYVLNGDPKTVAAQLKKDVTLRRDGKKEIKPSSVEILDKPDGKVVLYEFSTSNEITKDDHRVEFHAKTGNLDLTQSFFLDDMVWDGKREI